MLKRVSAQRFGISAAMAKNTRLPNSRARLREIFHEASFVIGSLNDALSLIGTVAAFLGLTVSQTSGSLPQLPLDDAPFPVRMVLYLLFAAGIGWTTGMGIRACGRLPREIRGLVMMLPAPVMAGFVAGTANWLVAPRGRTDLPQEFLMALMGTMLAIRTMIEHLATRRASTPSAQRTDDSVAPLVFAATAAGILLLAELGAR